MITKGRPRSSNIIDRRKEGKISSRSPRVKSEKTDGKVVTSILSIPTGSKSLSYKQVNNNRTKRFGKNPSK